MPNVRAVGSGTKVEDLPLLNAPDQLQESREATAEEAEAFAEDFQTPPSSCGSSWHPPTDSDEDPEEVRKRHEPDEDGKFWDDPLWFGKTKKEIEYATELEKSNGNAASRDGDWKKANRYWKNALRGAEKLQDADTEFRLHSNMALGYTKLKKIEKALDHCDKALRERLKIAVAPELRAKVHYRKAEAFEAAGEVSKAMASCKLSLEVNPENPDARKKLTQLKAQEAEQRKRERSLFAGLRGVCAAPAGIPDPQAPKTAPEAAGPDSSDEELAAQGGEDSDVEELTPEQEKILEQGLTDRGASARLLSSLGMAAKQGPADPSLVQPSNMTVGPEVFWTPENFKGKNVRQSLAKESL
ncbi:FKBP5 [Symbiodinium natans]|uniref:peptidylprolyl isomerase n=1 Tax=Symbiodinium natans TaxID=878477 RepID=A0A812MSM1_9DINO|nr:FKBP5 [Symbiodinium natans]